MKWAIEDYENVLRAFYKAQQNPETTLTQQTYNEWRKIVGKDFRGYLNPNKLANVRRDIIKNKRLNDAQIDYLRKEAQQCTTTEMNSEETLEPVVNVRNLNLNEVERMIEQVRNPGQFEENEETEGDELYVEELLDALFIQENENQISEARDDIIRMFTDFHTRESLPKLPFTSKVLKKKQKLQKEIETLRAESSILDEMSRGTLVKTKKSKRLRTKHRILDNASLASAKEKVKQVMQLKAQRPRRFDKRSKFFRQNKVFKVDAKKFYREIGKGSISVDNPPDVEQVTEFWNDIWGKEKNYNKEAAWVEREEIRVSDLNHQDWEEVTVEEVRAAIGKTYKWKSPGVDKFQTTG
ncbi:uncharacterized protein [Clytia hemisphaerica]|uniref:uncharacterized protein n=1 Tax=Clytia hemisphaerica TaxID=252671 RepID=UPI0034D430CB